MKIKNQKCTNCDTQYRYPLYVVEYTAEDLEAYQAFVDELKEQGVESLESQVTHWDTSVPLIPEKGEYPCMSCNTGFMARGPSGCGRTSKCLPFVYYSLHNMSLITSKPITDLLKEFTNECGVPAAKASSQSPKK